MGLIQFIKQKYYDLTEDEDDEEDDFEDTYEDGEASDDEEDEDASEKDDILFQEVDFNQFSQEDMQSYIKSLCDVMEESTRNISMAKREYDSVKSYFSDIQLIETAEEEVKKDIESTAEIVAELEVDRRIYKSGENKLTRREFYNMQRLDSLMPDLLLEMQSNEAYYDTVKHDMNMLEGEQMSLRHEAKELTRRQENILQSAKMSAFGLIFVFGALIAAMVVLEDLGVILFTIVLALSALLAIGLLWMMISARRQIQLVQLKLNRAAMLLNKVKIKYINIAGTVEYQRQKYHIKNSYELSSQYELFLQVKSEHERASRMTEQLSDAELHLESLLRQLDLFDAHIWLSQVKALIDPKEMVEVRHELATRRQKLRQKISYNEKRIEEAKANITYAAMAKPQFKQHVLDIISQYENNNE